MADLRKIRMDAGFSLLQVASVFGKTREWLRRVEVGTLPASPNVRGQIVEAIRHLSELRAESKRRSHEDFSALKAGLRTKV